MATRKSENNPSDDKVTLETVKETPKSSVSKDVTKSTVIRDIDFVINEVQKLKVLSDPKDKRNKTLGDILSLSNKVATTCAKKLEDIKSNL